MADTQDIIVRYQSEVDEAVKNIDKLAQAQDKITEAEKDQEKQAKETANAESIATKKRLENLKAEQAELKRLTNEKKKAFTVKDISAFNAKINESQKRISVLKNEISGSSGALNQFGSQAKNVFAGIAAGALAAFSTQAIINFASQSVKAFLDAEKNAERLRFAITAINGESELSFERLIKQSQQLQKITVFSDDSIQQAQAALSAFGLTADEIEKLIPKLADFATVTGTDIVQAADRVGAALEGNGREFKKYGIDVTATASATENLAAITDGLAKFQGAAEQATQTLTGSLQQQTNQVDELQESIGSKLAPAFVNLKKVFLEYLDTIITSKDQLTLDRIAREQQANAEKTISTLDATAKEIQRIYNIPFNEAYIKALELQIKVEEKARDSAAKSNLASSVKQFNDADQALSILNKELEQFNQKLEAEAIAAEEAAKRFLKLSDLKKKSTEDLLKLSEREKEINDEASKSNLKNIEEIIKAREKAADELKKNQKLLADLQTQNIEDEKQRRIAAFEQEKKDLTAQGQLRLDIITELEKKLVKDLNEIDKKRDFDPLFRVPELSVDQSVVLTPKMESRVKNLIEQGRTEAEAIAEVLNGVQDAIKNPAEGIERTWLEANQQILQSSLELFGELTNLFNTFADARIDRINAEKQASIESIDAQISANEEALKNRQITNRTEEQLNKKLQEDKVAAEKKADKEIRKIQRQQAILDKANALFQIALNTAIALADAKNLATFGALSPLIIALGAAQAAAVAAAPIPGFAKGTKGKKGSGMARVGEQGEEFMYLPHGTKVVPNKQTQKYGSFVDAMIDDNLERYIQKHYVAPQLMAQKRAYEQGSFSQTPTKARLYNPETKPLKFPSGMNIENYDELASAIASKLQNTRRRS